MKKLFIGTGITLLTLLLTILITSFNQKERKEYSDTVPVGTVIYSVLPPEYFLQGERKDNWAMLDGGKINPSWELSNIVQETKIMQNLNGNLPNASGLFLRAMNYFETGANPENKRVGEKQGDMLRSHKHSIDLNTKSSENLHFHKYQLVDFVMLDDCEIKIAHNGDHDGGGSPGTNISYVRIDKEKFYNNSYKRNVTSSGEKHSHTISYKGNTGNPDAPETGSETRPANISLYVYIKVN